MVNNRVDKRSKHIGHGGWKCICCNPFGTDRRRARRFIRRVGKHEMRSMLTDV